MSTPELPQLEPFYIIDFDRTTVDSDKLLEAFIDVAMQYTEITHEQIAAADADVKARGDSFDTAGYVRDHLAEQGQSELWDQLTKRFIHECRALNMYLPGAAELLDYFEASRKHFGILTYGNPLWQHLKLTAAGFNHVPRIVMTVKEKGRLIRSWQQQDGTFLLPHEFGGRHVSHVVMIDDKAVSFAEFPLSPSVGYWVLDPAHELLSQVGEVPSNVTRFSSLPEVLPLLKSDM